MTKQEAIQDQIDQIMDEFNFEAAQENRPDDDLPELRRQARASLRTVATAKRSCTYLSYPFLATAEVGFDEEEKLPYVYLGLYAVTAFTLNDGTTYTE